ncbi:MAG: SH3 domain-containing protein [Oscillospiraceae bacterium]|nr:SH3 domain-containing protein [Oscillospiraceae bacterium]
MKKRIISFLIAIIMLLGFVPVGSIPVQAEETVPATTEETVSAVTEPSILTASDNCLSVLKAEEGFSKTPYWDFTQYTVGYGTRCPADMVEYYTQNGITEAEAETLLRNHLAGVERDIHVKVIDRYGLELTQNQFDALVLFSYNCGTGWAYETGGTFHQAIATGATGNDLIRAFALWCSAGNQIRTFLLRRRLSEANMYLNAVYSKTPPDNYCYVLYDANGGSTSPRSQGYDSSLTATPFPVATMEGYTFQGWFTAKTGGTKVTVLDASTKSATLYAQWTDASGNKPPETGATPQNPVTITVTGTDVNLRQGPGTNYTRVGVAQKGQQLVITETASGSGYTWGKFDGGWIALQYTNYETAVNNQGSATTPETTPPTTEPPVTEPPVTEPPVTEPPVTQPEQPKVTGTINVQEWLRVRSGPGTSYSVVGYLKPKQKVEILEQSTVGSMKWGKISDGWISMDYVILDSNSSSNNNSSSTATSWTGKVIADELLIRSGPGTNYSILGYLTEGTPVTITEKKTNGSMEWGKIAKGWISLTYVQLNSTGGSSATPAPEQNTTTSVTGYANVQEWLNVRGGPGTSYKIVGKLKPKETVTITERKTVGGTQWGKISTGWVSMDYIVLNTSGGATSQSATKTITADCLRVRKAAGTSNTIVGYLYYGAKVQILETKTISNGEIWGRISNGWISMAYAK